jgi:hypothetical protein
MLQYAAEPEILIEQLRKDEAIAEGSLSPLKHPQPLDARGQVISQ